MVFIIVWLVVWNMAFIFPNSWDDDPIWRIFFRGVETTNQIIIVFLFPLELYTSFIFFLVSPVSNRPRLLRVAMTRRISEGVATSVEKSWKMTMTTLILSMGYLGCNAVSNFEINLYFGDITMLDYVTHVFRVARSLVCLQHPSDVNILPCI